MSLYIPMYFLTHVYMKLVSMPDHTAHMHTHTHTHTHARTHARTHAHTHMHSCMQELAQHPAISALLDYKWKTFGRWLFA